MENLDFYTVRGYQMSDKDEGMLSSSLEDYLEMIYREMLASGFVKVTKLALDLNVKPSSASKMIGRLKSLGYVNYEKYGIISLTGKGLEFGEYLFWRHDGVLRFLTLLSTDCGPDIFREAELIEHNLLPATVRRLESLLLFVESNPCISKSFADFLKKDK